MAKTPVERIDALDLTVFDSIKSQTSIPDKRSLLAVQRATARRHGTYAYLEIGSHLGGSIQPHLIDPRCTTIYSIDPRPVSFPDLTVPGSVAHYEGNSTARMLSLLGAIDRDAVSKIQCFEKNAPDMSLAAIAEPPKIALIDGEHTYDAATADFEFCIKVLSGDGTILFHDFDAIYAAILDILKRRSAEHKTCIPLKLEGQVFGMFFDTATVTSDPYLANLFLANKRYIFWLGKKERLRAIAPAPVWRVLQSIRGRLSAH